MIIAQGQTGRTKLTILFFNDAPTTENYTLSLHDALPISKRNDCACGCRKRATSTPTRASLPRRARSEEHTSELQSLAYLVCRLLLEKKKLKEKQVAPN